MSFMTITGSQSMEKSRAGSPMTRPHGLKPTVGTSFAMLMAMTRMRLQLRLTRQLVKRHARLSFVVRQRLVKAVPTRKAQSPVMGHLWVRMKSL